MPRIQPPALRSASPLLRQLLIVTRDSSAAANELRWLKAHARHRAVQNGKSWQTLLRAYCAWRGRHVPLQYILGSEYFGDLELRCRKGVLIPRQDTASITTHLAHLISSSPHLRSQPNLKILDLCTGTGCIPLLLHHLLSSSIPVHSIGLDIDLLALSLARSNLHLHSRSISPNSSLTFSRADVLAPSLPEDVIQTLGGRVDILTANPPYISPSSLRREAALSVARYEPRRALVPPAGDGEAGDVFYPAVLRHAVAMKAKGVMLEVGDAEQAVTVATLAKGMFGGRVEIWRDVPSGPEEEMEGFTVRGEGNVRAVFCCDDQRF
ncbi:hypothetical protein ANO11243_017220 [Dothideomycetidae sp. 11243]|nr:hypothetical protein ANO11243_017220 [fungal sp. No.11243]